MQKNITVRLRENGGWGVLALLALAFVAVSWFRGNHLISGVDLYFPQQRWDFLRLSFQAWDDRSVENDNFRMLAISLPYGLFCGAAELLNISLVATQKIWFYFLYAATGLSMFFLASFFTRLIKGAPDYLVALLAGIFYMFNPFLGLMLSSFSFAWQIYAFMPLKLALFADGMIRKKGVGYILAVCFVWIVLSGSIYVNPKILLLDSLLPALFALYYVALFGSGEEKRRAMRYSFVFGGILGLFSAYWLIPAFGGIQDNFQAAQKAYNLLGGRERVSTFKLNSATNLLEAARLWGYWAVDTGYKGERYYYWTAAYRQILWIAMGYLIFLAAIWPCLKKQNKYFYFFLALFLVSLAGMCGSPEEGRPRLLSLINLILVKHVPLFVDLFSLPVFYWGLFAALALSVLFAYGTYFIYESYLKNKVNEGLFSLLVLTLVVVHSLPVWSGEIFRKQTPIMRGSRYAVPDYYYQAADYYGERKLLSRIYPLPYSSQAYMLNSWESGFCGFGVFHLLSDRMISGMADLSLLTNKAFNSRDDSSNLQALLAFQGVRDVVLQNDANWSYYVDHPWYMVASSDIYRDMLENLSSVARAKTFGLLEFYKVDDKYFLPFFYIPTTVKVYDAPVESLLNDALADRDPRKALYFIPRNAAGKKMEEALGAVTANSDRPPILEFKKISASKYRVYVHQATSRFPLVFSTTFHPGWTLYSGVPPEAGASAELLASYKALDGNESDQPGPADLADYVRRGWVTSLGDGKVREIRHKKWEGGKRISIYDEEFKVDFISRNIQGTIQNDNLPDGSFHETWFKAPIVSGQDHLMANAYANSWILNPPALCGAGSNCRRNPDGSYDFSLVVEYWPQRIFILSLLISGISMLLGAAFLARKLADSRR